MNERRRMDESKLTIELENCEFPETYFWTAANFRQLRLVAEDTMNKSTKKKNTLLHNGRRQNR